MDDTDCLRQELADLQVRLSARDSELSRWRQQYFIVSSLWTSVQQSPGWKLTAPLRALRRWFAPRGFDERALIPWQQLQQLGPDAWRSHGPEPQFFVPCWLPAGWVRLQLDMTSDRPGRAALFADYGDGFHASECLHRLDSRGSVAFNQLVHLKHAVRGIRFDPLDTAGDFRLTRLRVQPLSLVDRVRLGWAERWSKWRRVWPTPGTDYQLTDQDRAYQAWRKRHALIEADRQRVRAEAAALPNAPLISVLVPAADERSVERTVDSVFGQLYPQWQLCIASAGGRFRPRSDPRVHIIATPSANRAEQLEAALSLAAGDYCALVEPGDCLAEDALWQIARAAQTCDVDWCYSDEDHVTPGGEHVRPFFKPDWSPETFQNQNYTGGLSVFRTALIHDAGGFRGEQPIYDLGLRFLDHQARVAHVPAVLSHRALRPNGPEGKPRPRPVALDRNPLVSIVIPCLGRPTRLPGTAEYHLARCLASVRRLSTYDHYEILVVHDAELPDDLELAARCIYAPEAPHRAALWNAGAAHATGEQLLFLHDDVEVLHADWLEALLEYALQPQIGAVGAKLLLADGRLHHAGFALLEGVPGSPFQGEPETHPGYFGNLLVPRNCSAVSGACLMTPRELFERVGGFTEALGLHYADVDYCLKVHEGGRRVVVTPYARLCQHATRSRIGTYAAELASLRAKWPQPDPYYNQNLSRLYYDYRL